MTELRGIFAVQSVLKTLTIWMSFCTTSEVCYVGLSCMRCCALCVYGVCVCVCRCVGVCVGVLFFMLVCVFVDRIGRDSVEVCRWRARG